MIIPIESCNRCPFLRPLTERAGYWCWLANYPRGGQFPSRGELLDLHKTCPLEQENVLLMHTPNGE